MQEHARQWSADTFGQARLGDSRRVRRLVQIGAQAADRPHGRISQVFSVKREREAAYDFVECGNVPASAIVEVVRGATARSIGDSPFVFAPVDGTSLKLWDGTGQKDFGRIGTHANGASGLKVMSSLFVSPEGVPLGLSGQVFWTRPRKCRKRAHHGNRAVADKETQHWMEVFDQVHSCRDAYAPGTKIWYQLDRGGDAWTILQDLASRGDWFTIRSKADRRIWGSKRLLQATIRRAQVRFYYTSELRGRTDHKEHADRMARRARLGVRASSLTRSETWKSGLCNVEETQLHSTEAVKRWATILAAVATRAEKLKHLSRQTPDAPASIDLTDAEEETLRLLRTEYGPRKERQPTQLTIAQAVNWIAEMGGYTGKSSGGPPGSITIQRGLEHLTIATATLTLFKRRQK